MKQIQLICPECLTRYQVTVGSPWPTCGDCGIKFTAYFDGCKNGMLEKKTDVHPVKPKYRESDLL